MVDTKDCVIKWPILRLIKDITIWPKILDKKAKKAIKSYGNENLQPSDVFLIIDNTIFRSAKQGAFMTRDMLFGFSEYSGKYSIKLDEIKTLKPEIKRTLKIPLFGITINEDYFLSLPGLNQLITEGEESQAALVIFTLFLAANWGCEIIDEE
jgi:hypothetical protein